MREIRTCHRCGKPSKTRKDNPKFLCLHCGAGYDKTWRLRNGHRGFIK